MHTCVPHKTGCEWQELKPFVEQYNRDHGASYTLARCTDVADRSSKQPEVLLVDSTRPRMVIERKRIYWPEGYAATHVSEEAFSDLALKLLGSQFRDRPYRLYVSMRDIPVGPNRAAELGRAVAGQVIARSPVIAEKGAARGRTPIPWAFHRLTQRDAECDYGPLHGVMVELEGSTGADLMSVTREDLKQNEVALGQIIETRLRQAAAKFDSYPDALKVVLLDFIGDDDFLLDDDIRRLVSAAQCPDAIDQVWVSELEPVSETDSVTVFRRVR